MCGIAGFLDYEQKIVNRDVIIQNMSDTLKRRGPDENGCFELPKAVLIHRRLSVVDIENGKQPMKKTINGCDYIITYNGELYNTDDIKDELKILGYEFKSYSDTEVVLTAYIEWGEDCVKKFNGIFAFAIYNSNDETLFIARDRAGVKPFFYSFKNGIFVFGSEIKTLLASNLISRNVNRYGIAEVFLIGPGRTPGGTAFSDIEELKPGWCGTVSASHITLSCYWKLEAKEHTDTFDETVESLKALIYDSISRQLVSDVPLCCFLSGGLDSSIISAVAAESYRERGLEPITTYSVDYTDNEKFFSATAFQPNSDDYFIDIMVKHINSDHRKVVINNLDLADALYNSVRARDLPGMADVDSSLLLFCKEVKKTHTVALSGECADEIFGGYPWFRNKEVLYTEDFPWSGNTQIKSQLIMKDILTFDAEDYVKERYLDTVQSTPRLGYESAENIRMREMTMLNMKWFMQTLLDRKDRMSMYSGLEVRVPFCDHRIMEYAFNIPWSMKNYMNREKGLVRHTFKDILPEEIVYRKKSPYPKTHNPIYYNAVKSKLKEVIDNKNAPIFEIADRNQIIKLFESDADIFTKPWYGQLMNAPQIMAYLYMINSWLELYSVNICKD